MSFAGLRARVITCIFTLLALAAAGTAGAETLSLAWDPSPDANVAGYIVYIRVPGGATNSVTVGNVLQYDWSGAADGQQYYFSVAAYSAGPIVGLASPEISRYPLSNQAPTLTNPGSRTSVRGTLVTLPLSATDPEGSSLTFNASGLPPGLSVSTTGIVSGTPTTQGTYSVTATVTDGALSDSETFSWTVTAPPGDTTAPAVSVNIPTGPDTSTTVVNPGSAPNAGSGTGSGTQPGATPTLTQPNPGVPAGGAPIAAAAAASTNTAPTSFWARRRAAAAAAKGNTPATTTATASTTGWKAATTSNAPTPTPAPSATGTSFVPSIAPKTVNAVAGAPGTTASASSAPQTSAPVKVTTQSSATSVWSRAKVATTVTTDKPVITLAGTAADDRTVSSVEFVTDRGQSGKASGTDTWIAAVPLLPGLNRVTITVRDTTGNASTSTVAVQYTQRK